MADAHQEILALNNRVDKARESLIKLQSRRENLIKNRDAIIQEIRDAGYNPSTLKETRDQLQRDLESAKQTLESDLLKAETILKSIPE